MDAAAEGDTVLVGPGTYTGPGNRDIELSGKAIVVVSENGPEETVIDCEGNPEDPHRGFCFRQPPRFQFSGKNIRMSASPILFLQKDWYTIIFV